VIYQRALTKEFPAHGLEYEREVWMDVTYKGEKVGRKRVDFVIGDDSGDVMVEIKAKIGIGTGGFRPGPLLSQSLRIQSGAAAQL